MTGGCRSCGDSYAAASSTDYRDALRPEQDLSWNAQPEEPDQNPASPPGWELDKETEDVTGDDARFDEFQVEVVGPDGTVRGGGRYTRAGGFTGNNPCYDQSEGSRTFEWTNYPDIKEPEGKGTIILCKGDTVKIKKIKTTGCRREHLQYELWVRKRPYQPSGSINTLGVRAKGCKAVWEDEDKDRKAIGGDAVLGDGDSEGVARLEWTPALSNYRNDEQGNYDAILRARCRGASYQSGFIIGDSFNICLSPNKYCTTCPTCIPKWIEGPKAEEKPGTLIKAKVRIEAVRQITEGTWFVNGVSSLKDRQGSLQGDCNLSKDFAFTFTAPQSGNVELKFKYKREGSLAGYECKGELIKTFKVTANPTPEPEPTPDPEPTDPCQGIVCPDGYVATKTGPNSCECFPITGTDPCKDVECPPGFEAIRTSENTCGCFKISDDPCKDIACPKGFEPVRTGPTTCGCFPIPEPPKEPNTPRPDKPPKLIGNCCDYDNKWNNWEAATQIVEHSHYDGLITRSSDSGPEHTITYVNESVSQDPVPGFELCTTAGLSLKANNQISSLDSVRAWVRNGRELKRIQKSKGDTGGLEDTLEFTSDPNASDNFADLVWFLLTGNKLGVGDLVKNSMVDAKQMRRTARYLEKYGLLFNGVIDDKVNVRDYIAELAPFFLCHFTIRNGLFTLIPVFPTEDDGTILDQAPLSATFDDYNIIEDSLKVTYLDQDERQLFHAEMKYRYNPRNTLPEERTVLIKFKNSDDYDSRPTEVFDMSDYCTTREHAVLAGRYFMALRKNITHGVTFKTLPDEMRGIGPGDYIRVRTDALPEKQLEVGSFSDDLEVLMVDGADIKDGTYNITWWKSEQEDLQKAEIDIKKGRVVGANHLAGALFSITPKNIGASGQTYMIEQVELDDDGLVEVTASNWPEYGAETSTRLTGAPVANGDSVMTFEVFGKPTETGGGGGDNPPAGGGVCREGITYYKNPECPGSIFNRDKQENGTCYPACFSKGSAVPYNGMALRGAFRSRGGGLGPEYDSNGIEFYTAKFRYQVNSTFGNASELGIIEEFQYGNKDDSDWRLSSFHGYGFNSYYKELALRPANKRVSLPITGVEILPYFPPPQSKNLAGREGVEVRYWLGGQIINRMCFIGILPEGYDPSIPDDQPGDPGGPAFFDQTIGDPDFNFGDDGNEWTLPDRYALYPFSNNPRFIFGGNRTFSSPGRNDDLISADEKTVYDLADGSVVWTWNEYNPLRNFIANDRLSLESYYNFGNDRQFLDTEDTWSNSGICQIPSAFDGYCHVMSWGGSPLDSEAKVFFAPYIPLKGFSIRLLNSQIIRDPNASFLRYSCADRTDTTFSRQRFGGYWVKRGKNTMRGNTTTRGTDHDYMDGYQTMATNTIWDFGYTPYYYASVYTLNYNSFNYKTGLDIEDGHDPNQGSFFARKYGSDERMSLFGWKGTAWIRGGVNSRMEVGALIQTADGSDASDPGNYGKPGFYALNLKGHLPPLRCWGISHARYYWEYKGGSGALRPEGMYTGAIIENGEIKIYYEGDIIYEGIAKLYHDDRDVTRNMFAYDCQGGKWEEGPRQRDRRVEMRYAGGENTLPYNSTQATRMLGLNLPILLTNYAEKDEKEAGAIYPTIYGDIVLHEWLTVLPEFQDLQPYKLGTGGRLTDFKEGDKWSINHGTLGAFELTDDHDYRGYFLGIYEVGLRWWGIREEEVINTQGVSWWRYKTPLPGLEYKFQELNEFGDMWPLPRNCPYWPNSVSEYSTNKGRTNYNLRINNRNNPYAGGNGFYSYLGIGELPTYFTQTYQISNKHTLPKEPDFYAPIGFTRLPFGWNYSTDSYPLVDSIVPYTNNRQSISRDYRWNVSRYSARPTYYANGADTTWIIEGYDATNYEGFIENVSRNEALNELALQKNVQNLGQPRRPNEYPDPPRSIEELDSYSNFTETEQPLYDGLPEDPFNNTPGSGETGLGAQIPYWIKYWGKLQRTRHPIQVEGPVYKGCKIELPGGNGQDPFPGDDPVIDELCGWWSNKSPYMNQPGVTYGQRDRYLEELGEEPPFNNRYRDDYQIWETTSCGHDKMDNFTYPQDVNEIPVENLVYLGEPRGTDVNDDALASYQANNSDYPPSNPNDISNRFYVQQKVWTYRYTSRLQKRRAHVYQPGWSGDAQTPPMTGVWIQGTEDVGSTAGFEDRSNVPRVSISFFLGGRLIWEHADYIPECGFTDGYYPATNYHPDLDALQETVGNTEGGLFPKGSTHNSEDPINVNGVEGAINTGGSYDHKRRVGSHYLLKEALRKNPPQVMSMDWDVTTVAYKEMRFSLKQEYRCDFQVGIYKDATPWFNGEDWSHEGPINGQPSRWEILANPATTSGRNGAYGLCLNGVLMPRNHWYEDAIEHYSMQGDPSDFNVFSGVIIRDKVMQFYYQGERIYVGTMKVYRNQDMYRVEDLNIPLDDRFFGYDTYKGVPGDEEDPVYPQFKVPARPDETNYQFKKIEIVVGGKKRVFGVGRLVDLLEGNSLGTKHLTMNANGEIGGANRSSHYPVNNAVKGSADMRTIWVTQGPGKDFAGYWTLHEYRTEDIMEGPGWDDNVYDQQVKQYRKNVLLWNDYPATIPGEFPEATPEEQPSFIREDNPPSDYDYDEQKANWNAINEPPGDYTENPFPDEPFGRSIKRNTRSREEIYRELDPRLVEGATEDDYDFTKPCSDCTPDPEDI